jgi:hypothetical protein
LILKQKNIIDSWIIRATGFIAPLQAIYKEANITYDRNGNLLTYQRWCKYTAGTLSAPY